MPWVVLDFLSFLTKLIICVMGVMMWSISLKAEANADTSFLIGVTILVAVGLGEFYFLSDVSNPIFDQSYSKS